MFTLDNLFLLLTGLLAAYLCWYFWRSYNLNKALHNIYYLMGFAVLLISGLLLIFFGLGILASPYVLTVASLIPLGISMGMAGIFRMEEILQVVRHPRLRGNCRLRLCRHRTDAQDLGAALPRGCRAGHLPGTPLRQESRKGLLVGGHRWRTDRDRRDRPGVHFDGRGSCCSSALTFVMMILTPLLLLMTMAFHDRASRKQGIISNLYTDYTDKMDEHGFSQQIRGVPRIRVIRVPNFLQSFVFCQRHPVSFVIFFSQK